MNKKLKVPAAQDIARLIRPTAEETEDELYRYYADPSGGFFSYRRAHILSPYAFGHTLPLAQILDGCAREHTQEGRLHNALVLSLLWDLAAKRSVVTYPLKARFLHIRRDMPIRVAPPFYFVENQIPSVFWLQPRKTHALSYAELGLLASIVKAAYLVDDFKGVGFEVCDLSAPLGIHREPRTYDLTSFTLLTEPEVLERLQRFAIAYDRLVARGVEQKKRPAKRPPKRPDLFGEPE